MTSRASTDATVGVPPFVRVLRAADRAVLDLARHRGLRPMEVYLLVLLLECESPARTHQLASRLAASPSQAKQLALALQARGLAERAERTGLTALTAAGQELARELTAELRDAFRERLGGLRPADAWRAVDD